MVDDSVTMATAVIGHNRRLLIITLALASIAFLIVITSVVTFLYITRKEKTLRKLHLILIGIILSVELVFLIAVVTCCIIQSKSVLGQILAAVFILMSLLSLLTLIYFLLEDTFKDKIDPCPPNINSYRSYEVQEIKTISRHETPIPTNIITNDDDDDDKTAPTDIDYKPISTTADDRAVPIILPTILPPLPRIPTPPAPSLSPGLDEKSITPSERNISPITSMENILIPLPSKNKNPYPQESAFVVDFDKVRRDLLTAIEERTIPALEEAIQQVKNYNYIQQLKYECERALELLNRLMKIEHMKIRVLRLNQATIAELHSYTKPPDEVYTVMRATFLLLGHTDREIQEWSQVQNLLGRLGRESVRRRCYELNPLSIPFEKAHEAKDILRRYDLIRVSEISVGLAAFFSWGMTMIEEREKLLDSQRKLTR